MRKNIGLSKNLYDEVVKAAKADHVPIEEFVSTALSTQLAGRECIESRARLFNREEFERALEVIPDVPPDEHDRITERLRTEEVSAPARETQRADNTQSQEIETELDDSQFIALRSQQLNIDQLLRRAIKDRRIIRLRYRAKERIVEPHDYGVQNGRRRLLAYQIAGSSNGPLPNWRLMDVDLISELEPLDKTFRGGRRVPSGKHYTWDQLYIRVTADETPHRVQ